MKKYTVIYLFALFTVCFISSPITADSGSCRITGGICFDFKKGMTQSEAQNSCMKYSFAEYSTTGCSNQDLAARCDTVMPSGSQIVSYFYKSHWNYASARERCDSLKGRVF